MNVNVNASDIRMRGIYDTATRQFDGISIWERSHNLPFNILRISKKYREDGYTLRLVTWININGVDDV